jgi:hypothetical protein
MAKNSIRDFDNTAGNNTDIQSVDIAEQCAPSGINNAIRELMADMADVNDGTVALVSPAMDSADINGGTIDGTVIGGTTPAAGTFTTGDFNTSLNVDGTITSDGLIVDGTYTDVKFKTNQGRLDLWLTDTDTTDGQVRIRGDANTLSFITNTTVGMTIDASQNVDVAGTITSDGLTVGDGHTIGNDQFDNLTLLPSSGENLVFQTPSQIIMRVGATTADDGTDAVRVDTSGNLGIGTSSPDAILHTKASGQLLRLESTAATGSAYLSYYDSSALKGHVGYTGGSDDDFNIFNAENANIKLFTNSTLALTIDSSQNVGIGESDPQYQVQLSKGNAGGVGPVLYLKNDVNSASVGHAAEIRFNLREHEATSRNALIRAEAEIAYGASPALTFHTSSGNTGEPEERMRIRSSGSILMSRDDAALATTGHYFDSSGYVYHTRDAGQVLYLNRKTSDGEILGFYKDGSTVGSIGTVSGYVYIANNNGDGMALQNNAFRPSTDTGSNQDNVIDLGLSASRFDDIYATNGTIQTSDANEKQQIASLTDAEITAAKAISKLFKTFKWNDSVEEKGDAARTHAGVIAQDVQQAMSDAGLDAANYAFWCSDTWWETQTEVPAVEAVEAQDAVYDDDGNLVSEAVEAVAARDAYTRTDTYDTAEEAPEGATERTRMGIRYPELLAFIGAATEQRLADIETRLTALETL